MVDYAGSAPNIPSIWKQEQRHVSFFCPVLPAFPRFRILHPPPMARPEKRGVACRTRGETGWTKAKCDIRKDKKGETEKFRDADMRMMGNERYIVRFEGAGLLLSLDCSVVCKSFFLLFYYFGHWRLETTAGREKAVASAPLCMRIHHSSRAPGRVSSKEGQVREQTFPEKKSEK